MPWAYSSVLPSVHHTVFFDTITIETQLIRHQVNGWMDEWAARRTARQKNKIIRGRARQHAGPPHFTWCMSLTLEEDSTCGIFRSRQKT
eukprot:359879-Chlamydomonas_euryale.AAC.4